MNCPEHLIADIGPVRIWHIQRADVPRDYVSWWEVLNPLRYEIAWMHPEVGARFTINEDAIWNRRVSNALFRVRRRFFPNT